MVQSGDMSRSKGSSGHTRSGHSIPSSPDRQGGRFAHKHIIAVEADGDESRHRRIDQGLLDASREAEEQQKQQVRVLSVDECLIFC